MKSLTLVSRLAIVLCLLGGSRAALAQENPDNVQGERPSLPEVWRTNMYVGPQPVVADGIDGQHVLAFGEYSLASFRSSDGMLEWEIKPGFSLVKNLIMLRSRPVYIMAGYSNGSGIGVIQTRRYPTSEIVSTIFEPLSGGPIAVSDNERFVAGSYQSNVMVWDLESGEKKWTLPKGNYNQFQTCWTRDSTRLIVTAVVTEFTREVSCWDVENNVLVWRKLISGNSGPFFGQMSGDGKRIIFHDKFKGGYEVREFPGLDLVFSQTGIGSLYIEPSFDARYIILGTGGGHGAFIGIRNIETGSVVEIDSSRMNIALSSNQGYIYAWDTGTLRKLRFDWAVSVSEPSPPIIRSFFPNPCGGEGMFEYDVPGSQVVNLVLYNLEGQPVRQLVLAQQTGPQRVPVDCGSLAAGTYYCVLVIGKEKFTLVVQVGGQGGVK